MGVQLLGTGQKYLEDPGMGRAIKRTTWVVWVNLIGSIMFQDGNPYIYIQYIYISKQFFFVPFLVFLLKLTLGNIFPLQTENKINTFSLEYAGYSPEMVSKSKLFADWRGKG